MYVTTGDTPAAPLLVLPARDGDPVDLERYTEAQAQLVQPDGTVLQAPARIDRDDPDDAVVAVTLPKLEQAGLVAVAVQLGNADTGQQDTFDVPPVVVQRLDGWHTLGSARAEWTSADLDDVRLFVLLEQARAACLAYKPEAGTRRPLVTEREAQLVLARNRYAASGIDPATGDDGVNGYSAAAFPMDWTVKALLYPPRRFKAIR